MISTNNIYVVSTNEEKPNTCGSCKHSDNELGFVSLRCKLLNDEMNNQYDKLSKDETDEHLLDYDKVRSWSKCYFEPSKYEPRENSE